MSSPATAEAKADRFFTIAYRLMDMRYIFHLYSKEIPKNFKKLIKFKW